ncbi:MAG: AAA family ATPase, partial [Nitrospira sp.]|nr:AAA family ATPase [Nitrospira sp.]
EMGGGNKLEQLALGETLNIAARLQSMTEPDTILISGATYRLIQGFFVCKALGVHKLKGFSHPVEVYQVLGESDVRSRFEVSIKRGLTPMVGREQEARLLLECWQRAQQEIGQVVLLTGEAGIGKSRLIEVLKEQITGEPHTRLTCYCSPYYQNSALYPVIDLLHRMLGWRREDFSEERLGKLEAKVREWTHERVEETVSLLASLLSLQLPDRYPPLQLTPQRQREKTLETLLTLFQAMAVRQPVLFVIEDLYWADPSTLELIKLFMSLKSTTRILMILTFRPEFSSSWSIPTDDPINRFHWVALSRLDPGQVEILIRGIVKGKALPTELVQEIVIKTDGIPLLVEEMTKAVLGSALLREYEDHYELIGSLPRLVIPDTIHDLLTTRLDQLELATVKEVAQVGAVLGREFSYELLRALLPLNDEILQGKLTQLVKAELLSQQGIPPQAKYLFKHALIWETAYELMLRSKRQQYHQQIAQVLQERFPEVVEIQPELVAHHYTEADLKESAIVYWQKAGQRAVERSAYIEAIHHFTKGLELLKTLPDTPERIQQELALQIALGVPLTATKGYAAPEVEKVYTRAYELCQQV